MTLNRKLTLVRKAIDHVVDGDAIPKWVSARDKEWPDNRMLFEMWRLAVAEVSAGLKAAA